MPDPRFDAMMDQMVAASGGLLARGGSDRSVDEQIALRRKNGCPDIWTSPASSCRIPTAIPGRSWHQKGLAEDVLDAATGKPVKAGSAADRWMAANASQYGLHRPVGTPGGKGWEPWHVEPVDVEAMAGDGDFSSVGMTLEHQDMPGDPQSEIERRIDAMMQVMGAPASDQVTGAVSQATPSPEQTTGMQPGQPMLARGPTTPVAGGWANGVPPPGYEPPGKGVDRWRPVVEAALRYVGEPVNDQTVTATLRRIQQESGGNPRIVNTWDSNAMKGDPSTGLVQNIPSAFAGRAKELANRGITDGFANLVAGMRWSRQHYGSVMAGFTKRGGY